MHIYNCIFHNWKIDNKMLSGAKILKNAFYNNLKCIKQDLCFKYTSNQNCLFDQHQSDANKFKVGLSPPKPAHSADPTDVRGGEVLSVHVLGHENMTPNKS